MDPHSSHSQKVPYARKEKRKSLFSKVKESVKDMLSPSWLSDLVTNVKKDSPPQSSDKGQLKVKDAFMSPLSSMPVGSGIQRPGMQQLQTDFLPFQNQATSLPNGQPRTLDYRMPTMGPNEGMSPYSQINIPPPISEFSSSQLPLARLTEKSDSVLANEDTMSQRSDVSKSTSGCSSMVPQTDLRGSSGGVGLTKRKASDGETTNSRSPLSLQDQPSKRQRLQVNINSSNTWSRRLNDTVTKQQLPAAVNKPSFNSSLFGSPMTDESSLLGSSFHESSFYPGKTTFGGRSSVGFRTNKRKTDLNQSLPSRLSIPVKAFMKAKPRANPTKEAVTSSTAKRILDALDKMPTPLNDARRIPVILPQHWTESSSFFSRDKTTGPHGPPTQQLNISSLASISKNRQVSTSPRRAAPQPSTSQSRYDYNAPPQARPSRQDTVMLGNSGPAAASSGKMKRDKSYHRGSASAKTSLEQEDTVILPEIKGGFGLPMSSMPKFDFSTPSGTPSSQSKPAPSFAPVNFTFSSPIQETVPRTKPASPQGLTGFQFSSPIRVDDKKKETVNTDKDTSNKQMFAFSTPVPSSNTTPVSKMNGPSTPVNSFSGGMQPAATLKQGSVMDILGGGGGGFKPAAELKKGSVMDFLGGGQDSDTEQDTSVLDILHSAKKSTSSSTTFPASSSPSGFLLFTGIGGVKPSTGPALSSLFKAQGWSCDACLLNNKEEASKCVACQSPRPSAQPKAAAPAAAVAPSLSAMFKPSGWSCDICLVNNSDSADKCLACQTAKPKTSTQKTDVSSNLLSKFQQPSGSWTCDACLLQNKSVDSKCVACQTSKSGSATPSHTSLVASHGSLMPGNWICNTCLIQNRKDVTVCGACQSVKPLQTSMLNAGVGKQQINNILAEFNLPAINPVTVKKREQEIDKYLKEVSNDTTENTAPTQLKSNQATQNTDVKIKKESIIVFDLETTGFGIDENIIQIAAKHMDSGDTFNTYVYPPNKNIPTHISKITGLEIQGDVMLHNGTPVEAESIEKALTMFYDWLASYENQVLIAHNANFDARILINSYNKNMMPQPNISGFGDSLKLFKQVYPGLPSYRQADLVKNILNKNYDEHNAIADVESLADLLLLTVENVKSKLVVFTVQDVLKRNEGIHNEHKYLRSYNSLIENKHIAKCHAKTLSSSGLGVYDLQLASSQSGVDGLTTKIQGIFSNPEKVASKLFEAFQNM